MTADIGGQFNQYLNDDGLDDPLWTASLASSEFDDEIFSSSVMLDHLLATFEETITGMRGFDSTKAWYVKSEVDLDPAVIDSISQQRSVALAALCSPDFKLYMGHDFGRLQAKACLTVGRRDDHCNFTAAIQSVR